MLKQNALFTENLSEKLSPVGESWSIPLSSSKRDLAIETALFGTAIGEAFGAKFEGLSTKLATQRISSWSKDRFEEHFPPRHGLMAFISISAGQALLECRSNPAHFASRFGRRVRFHSIGRLLPGFVETIIPGASPAYGSFRTGPMLAVDRFFPAAVFMSAVLQGTTNRITPWAAALLEGAKIRSESAADVVGFVKLISRCAQAAIFHSTEYELDARATLQWLCDGANEPPVLEWLDLAQESLKNDEDLSQFAQRLENAFGANIAGDPRFVAMSAIYTWLRHPTNWADGLIEAASLGGHTTARCSVYSGLASLATDGDCLSLKVVERHHWWPISAQWLNSFIFRLLQWPHGESDLVAAHAVRSPIVSTTLAHPIVGMRILLRGVLNRAFSLFGGK